jgi:hypothetical protein
MATKDTPSNNEDGTTSEESNTNNSEALGFIENMVAHAATDDDYRVIPMPDFNDEYIVETEVGAVDGDYHEHIFLPAEVRGKVLFIRVGYTFPSDVDVVVATTKRDLPTLLSDGFGYDEYDDVDLPIGDEMLELEVGSDKMGDA